MYPLSGLALSGTKSEREHVKSAALTAARCAQHSLEALQGLNASTKGEHLDPFRIAAKNLKDLAFSVQTARGKRLKGRPQGL